MTTKTKRKRTSSKDWPKEIKHGRATVKVYRRKMPNGNWGFMVANYSSGKRRWDSYPNEAKAIEAAKLLARRMSKQQVVAASMTNADAAAYAAAVDTLEPYGVSLPVAAETLARCLKTAGDPTSVLSAVNFWALRNKPVTRMRVSGVVGKMLTVKRNEQSSERHLGDLRSRLGRFAGDFQKDCCDVTTAEIQHWLDDLELTNRSKINYRTTIRNLFAFAVARGYAVDNPVKATQTIKADDVSIEIYTPVEMRKLVTAASIEFVPSIVLGGFAGLRSNEIQRLTWEDIQLTERNIIVGIEQAKTATRRNVPMWDNCAEWLAPYAGRTGLIWGGGYSQFYDAQKLTAENAGIDWKRNALRHSYASYRFALTTDAGRVAGELGNSVNMVHKHYREPVTPRTADMWFNIKPDKAASNIISVAGATT
jgi:integrase